MFKKEQHAIIVSGESLYKITARYDLELKFIDICSKMKVIIACWTSPKQKAEIVEMIRSKYPNKTTLSIGDGANDVNMILAAHVGVGIQGLEGA